MSSTTQLERELIETGRALFARRLAWGTSGNCSARIAADRIVVSASGSALGTMTPHDLVTVHLPDGHSHGPRRPSKELPMHLGIYRQREDARVILHSSPPYTTLFACSHETIPPGLFVESMYYLERIAWVDYAHPGSPELGESVQRAAADAEVIMLRNHGVILFDVSCQEALLRLETLEMACRLIVEARSAGIRLESIPSHTVREFLEGGRYKPPRPWHPGSGPGTTSHRTPTETSPLPSFRS